jgi:CRP/FNR family transcriptional regulator, cyclic AMP receptor protein
MAGAPPEALRRVPLFADLDERELGQVARLFKQRRFAPGETVTKEGLGGAAFFLIDAGEADVTVGGAARGTLGPGDFFGEIALIDEGARTATITATSELHCYGLTLWEFRPLLQENGAISWKLLQALTRRVRTLELGSAKAEPSS